MILSRLLPCVVVVLAVSAGAQQRTPAAGSGRAEPGDKADDVELLFVDPGGKPLPEAEVRLAVEDEHGGVVPDATAEGGFRQGLRLAAPPLACSVDGYLAKRPTVRPSATGKLEIPWTRERGLLVAGCVRDSEGDAELWGFRWFPSDWRETAGRAHPSGAPLVVELAPDWDLHVRIEDGARVVRDQTVRVTCGPWGYSLGNAVSEDYRFEHVGSELFHASEPLFVGLSTLLSPPLEVILDPHRAPAGPVVLRLPPVGIVEVDVLEADEKPTQRYLSVWLSFASDPEPAQRRFDPVDAAGVSAGTMEGKARFAGVSLGRELEVRVRADPPIVRRIRGPSAAGEIVAVTVVLPPRVAAPPQPYTNPADSGAPTAYTPEPEGTVEGFVLLDPGVPPGGIELTLRNEGVGGEVQQSANFARDGKFTFGSVAVGPARLEIWPRAFQILKHERNLAVFALDLAVVPGDVQDARLATIDLRGKLFAHDIRLTGVDRDGPFHARAFFGPAGKGWMPRAYDHVYQLPLVLVSPWKTIDLDLFAPGYRRVSLLDVGERVEVELEPGIPVRLRLVTDGVLPEPPLYLKALLVPEDVVGSPQRGLDWEGPAFGPTRELVTTAWAPGRTKIQWIASRELEGSRSSAGVNPDVSPAQYIDVRDSSEEQVFDVEISADELARLLRRSEE